MPDLWKAFKDGILKACDEVYEKKKSRRDCLKRLKVNTRKTKVMVSRSEGKLFMDSCGVCGRRVMANSVLCVKCENWVHGRCANIKRATARLAMYFICSQYKGIMEGMMDSIEKLCNEVKT